MSSIICGKQRLAEFQYDHIAFMHSCQLVDTARISFATGRDIWT